MNNWDFFNSKCFIYMNYLTGEMRKFENEYTNYFKTRDEKLRLLLEGDLAKAKEEIDKHIKSIKDDINKMDINSLKESEMNNLAETFDRLYQYFEYIQLKCKEKLDGVES